MSLPSTTIAAQATPAGSGGVGIIRISGPLVPSMMKAFLHKTLEPRYAYFGTFYAGSEPIDEGVAIYFAAPSSFTGEDVLELQGHGGQVVLERILQHALQLGAQQAKAGEFSYRAFLNGRLDLAQAEAIADLISAKSAQAAKLALRSLQGAFTNEIHNLTSQLTSLRALVEHFLDFDETEDAPITIPQLKQQLTELITKTKDLLTKSSLGAKQQAGLKLAIVGKPNAGKSTLFNYLCRDERAIVTDIPGTTRDVLIASVQLAKGLTVEVIDTAGFRDDPDIIEAKGILLAKKMLQLVDRIIYLVDGSIFDINDLKNQLEPLKKLAPVTVVFNKIDQLSVNERSKIAKLKLNGADVLLISLQTGENLDGLINYLVQQLAPANQTETLFGARARQLQELTAALNSLLQALSLLDASLDWTMLAEELTSASSALARILGIDLDKDMLDAIFSSFCVGK